MRSTRIPKGYTPVTYEQLAYMTGLSVDEMRRCAADMQVSGVLRLISDGRNLYYKLNLGEAAHNG